MKAPMSQLVKDIKKAGRGRELLEKTIRKKHGEEQTIEFNGKTYYIEIINPH